MKTLRKEESQYARGLIEASLDPLVTISINGKITDMNQATVNVLGQTREQLTGKNFFDYFTEPEKATEVYEEVFAKGFVANYPLTIRDHKLIEVLFNGSVYKDDLGNVLGAVVVARDITEQKRIERELTEAIVFAELATTIAEDAKGKAERATQLAEDAVKAKQQFLSNMSHEIRTPMNAIIGFTKVVLKTELNSKQKEYLTAIKTSGDALIVLINDILDLAKVDAGKMTFEQSPFKLSKSINAMLHIFQVKIQEKNLELVKQYDNRIPEVLLGDSIRLHQIILNLLSNAVKFTSEGKITISVSLAHENDKQVTIKFEVQDTGIGIMQSKIENIFENFQQASSDTSRLYGGTGLGLAIVKKLVESQGGKISVKSQIDKGSSFSFSLDFLKTEEKAELEIDITENKKEISKLKILVVEDIPLNQLLMKTLLDEFGFEEEIASNGKIAIEKLQQSLLDLETKPYDVILMDLQMPEMNGFEATRYIRTKLKSDIPIIALSADVTTVDLAKCIEVGMNDYITKPVDEKLLYAKIMKHFKSRESAIKIQAVKQEIKTQLRCTDLTYLREKTKSNRNLMQEMINLYLQQTPILIGSLKEGLLKNDWDLLSAAAHKIIPSFSIMGIIGGYDNIAKEIVAISQTQKQEQIKELVEKLDTICAQACQELEEELKNL